MQRYLMVDAGPRDCHIEVLESFRYGGETREFNVRLRRGIWASDEALIDAIRMAFAVPDQFEGSVLSMAGDKTIQFNPKEGKNVSQSKTDDTGVHPRSASVGEDVVSGSAEPTRPTDKPTSGRHNPRRPR